MLIKPIMLLEILFLGVLVAYVILITTQLGIANRKIIKYETVIEQQNQAVIKMQQEAVIERAQQKIKEQTARLQIKRSEKQIAEIMSATVPQSCEEVRRYGISEAQKLVPTA